MNEREIERAICDIYETLRDNAYKKIEIENIKGYKVGNDLIRIDIKTEV